MVAQFQRWEQTTTSGVLAAYRDSISAQPGLSPQHTLAAALLRGYLLEKACYEMLYELNNRPQWLMIPISGILTLLAPNEPIQ
jgi:maltose alpha-D-glucosyltransferase/alpha-amylase